MAGTPLNPQAFPDPGHQRDPMNGEWLQDYEPGMTLRDWFAGQALAGLSAACVHKWPVWHWRRWTRGVWTCGDSPDVARIAYDRADAMLAERAKREGRL